MRPKGSSHQIWILGGPDGEDPRSLPFAGADDAMATRLQSFLTNTHISRSGGVGGRISCGQF